MFIVRLMISKSKNSQSLYAIKSIYVDGKRSTKIVEKLGALDELEKIHDDPISWARQYIAELTEKEKTESREVIIKRKQSKRIEKNEQAHFNGGYLFLQALYHQNSLHNICQAISEKYKFTFNLDAILSRLIYGRILFPNSKLSTFQFSKSLLEQPDFDTHHIYRALEILEKENDFIQAELYKNSIAIAKRNDKILYYDCTNYFFQTEQAEGLRQYGISKEHRPNPIVEMGLLMDGDGIPLAFSIHSGNTNEQTTLRPLEERIMQDFKLSKFIICTDAGLSSTENRKFNNRGNRAFITTQSVKKLRAHLKEWALSSSGWRIAASPGQPLKRSIEETLYDISNLDVTSANADFYENVTFYKERWINEDGLEQKLIVTFSLKYRNYQRQIRAQQIQRAITTLGKRPSSIARRNQNDFKRFIKTVTTTADGEVAKRKTFLIDQDTIEQEEAYDGFYALCTNLEDDPTAIIRVNQKRWEIEDCFRMLKTEFRSRPVYLQRDDRIVAHFITCFIALTLFRLLERKLDYKFTSSTILNELRDMNFCQIAEEGYIPTYTRTDLTDALHAAFGFQTDYQIISISQMKRIFKLTKK